ncbi:DUF418 domain-containing protein [Sphingobium sp. AS12]|uniref:DUF418 domain-containing protein n=1 Tax=Sphingobium sp. AS12 TaxID=2849495 RepID=UPI001C31C481|nr:DUF418 domain-containing protein [Sphingobium sp. AS12]MBV2150102.1 DUF418 domain-containing protein [Sphingobium sp. AS12]
MPETERCRELDGIRGFAVMGIGFMNVFFFSMPGAAYYNPRVWGGTGMTDLVLWALSFVFIEDKMRGLFLALFGAGAMLAMERAGANGAVRAHVSRMAWLLMFGLFHGILVAANDVLRLYAVTGLLLPLFRRSSPGNLMLWIALLAAIHMAALGYVGVNWLNAYAYAYVKAHPAEARLLAVPERMFGSDPDMIEAQLALYRGEYWPLLARRLTNFSAPLLGLLAYLPITLAGMLTGVVMLRTGFLTGTWSRARYHRWALGGFVLGGVPLALLACWAFASGFAAIIVGANALVWSTPFDMVMVLGWVAALILLIQRIAHRAWYERIAAVGRASLTNYLGTSLLFGFAFYGWGLGLYGRIGRAEAYVFPLLAALLAMLWSKPWLATHYHGPLERLWRLLARPHFRPIDDRAA